MELTDQVVVVTGGASGIGRAMAQRFAEEGARGIVIADLDGDKAQRAAAEIGDRALGVVTDVADPHHADKLLETAHETFGPVDLFCANAGVAVGADLGTAEEWRLAFDVNINAHIVAARAVLPGWLERGHGYFLTTASAAGIVSQIGSAPYAVTKHAAVAFAEWLAITYGDRGVRASALCPMGVRTPLLTAGLEAGDPDGARAAQVVAAAGEILEPEQVADVVVAGLRDERFLILPHPEVERFFQFKAGDYDRWLAGMRKLQAKVAAATP